MRRANGIAGLLFLVVGLLFAVESWELMQQAQKNAYGQELFPLITSLGFVFCGILLAVLGFSRGPDTPVHLSARGVALSLGASAVYVVVMQLVGFALATGATLAALFRVLGLKWVASLLLAVGFTLLFYYLFDILLYMGLPDGIFGF